MSIFLFCFLIVLWTVASIQTHNFLFCISMLFVSVGIFLLTRKDIKIRLPKTSLKVSKVFLTISFWSCVALCLNAYQESIDCINCMISYLKHIPEPNFSSEWNFQNIKSVWVLYPRFIVLTGLFILWAIAFTFMTRRKSND